MYVLYNFNYYIKDANDSSGLCKVHQTMRKLNNYKSDTKPQINISIY